MASWSWVLYSSITSFCICTYRNSFRACALQIDVKELNIITWILWAALEVNRILRSCGSFDVNVMNVADLYNWRLQSKGEKKMQKIEIRNSFKQRGFLFFLVNFDEGRAQCWIFTYPISTTTISIWAISLVNDDGVVNFSHNDILEYHSCSFTWSCSWWPWLDPNTIICSCKCAVFHGDTENVFLIFIMSQAANTVKKDWQLKGVETGINCSLLCVLLEWLHNELPIFSKA